MSLNGFKAVLARLNGTRRAYHTVFDGAEGQIVLTDILRTAGMLQTSVVAGDAQMTAFNEGKRAIGLHIINHLRWSETEVMQLALQRTAQQLHEAEEA